MQLNLPEHIIRRVQWCVDQGFAESPVDAVEKALTCFELRFDKPHLHEILQDAAALRGMAKDWTLDELLHDRRDGLL